MAPATVRTPTRKALAALPETNRLRFLCAASKLLAETAPEMSSYLGSRALQWADQKKLPGPKVAPGQLCHQCGAYCIATEASSVRLSSQCWRRRHHNKNTINRAPDHTVAVVLSCQVCGCRLTFTGKSDLQKVFPNAKACCKVIAQQQPSHSHPETKATMQQCHNSTQQAPCTLAKSQSLLNKTPLHRLHSHTQAAAPPEASQSTLPASSCDKLMLSAEHGSQETSQHAEHDPDDLLNGLGTQESAQSAANWQLTISLSTPSPMQISVQPASIAVGPTEPCPSAAKTQPPATQPVSPMEDRHIALAVTQSSPHIVESTPKDQANQPSTIAASYASGFAVSSKTVGVQAADRSKSARDTGCNSDRAEVGVKTAIAGAEDTHSVAVDVAGAAGCIGPTEDVTSVRPHCVTSSINAGQDKRSSLHKQVAAVAATVMNGGGNSLSRDSSIADTRDEAHHLATTRPATTVSHSSQNVAAVPIGQHKSKPARFSWHKTGRVWKPKRLHVAKSVRRS